MNTRRMALGFLTTLAFFSWTNPNAPVHAKPQRSVAHDARMAWWRNARFGMFIH